MKECRTTTIHSGFRIQDPSALLSTSSTTAPITSSTQTSTLVSSLTLTYTTASSPSSQTSSNSTSSSSLAMSKTASYQSQVSKSAAVGLGVGLGGALDHLHGGFWFHRIYRQQEALAATVTTPALTQCKRELDGHGPWKDLPLTEMYTGRLTPTLQELGESPIYRNSKRS